MTSELKESLTFIQASKKIFALALPMAGTQLINVASGFLCMAMLAALGHEILAASALIFTTQLSIMVSGMSILFSLSVLVGHAYGAKDYSTIGNYVQQGWTLALLISIPIMILFWHIDSILILFGESKEITSIVRTYFHAFVFAVIPGFFATCNQQFGYGIHKKLLIIFTSAASVIILLITAYILIFGKFGFPKLGVAGLGYATVAQYSFFFIFTTLFFYFETSFQKFELFRYRVHQHLEHFVNMFKISWPISVQIGGEMLSFFVSAIMIGWIGTSALAAFQVVNQYYMLIVIPIFSLSQASGILIGHAHGAKQLHSIKPIGHASITITFIACLLVAFAFIIFPKYFASFYLDIRDPMNTATLRLTIILFLILGITQIFDGLRNIAIGLLRGLFDTRYPMIMGLITLWMIGIPLSYILAFPLHFGAPGFVFGELLGFLSGAVCMMYRWHLLSKRIGINQP